MKNSVLTSFRNSISWVRSQYLFNKRREKFQSECTKIFKDFCLSFKDADLEFWLVFGTLLGAVRENGIISHDIDIDVGVKSDIDFKRLHNALKNRGFDRTRKINIYSQNGDSKGFELTYAKNGVSIDIFVFYKIEDNLYYTHAFFNRFIIDDIKFYRNVLKIDFPIESFETIDFIGQKVYIPSNANSFLQAHYGPNFMTPNPKWKITDSYKGRVLTNAIGLTETNTYE